jgi:hypothetical protein
MLPPQFDIEIAVDPLALKPTVSLSMSWEGVGFSVIAQLAGYCGERVK